MERELRELETALMRMGMSLEEIDSLGLGKLSVKSPTIKNAFVWEATPQGWEFWDTKNREQIEWMEKREEWKFWVTRLFLYAHELDCPCPFDCPEEHDECAMRLGLDTALAWRIAKAVEIKGPTKETLKLIEFADSVALLHCYKYQLLDYLIVGLYYAVRRETHNV